MRPKCPHLPHPSSCPGLSSLAFSFYSLLFCFRTVSDTLDRPLILCNCDCLQSLVLLPLLPKGTGVHHRAWLKISFKRVSWNWKDGSVVKSTSYSCRSTHVTSYNCPGNLTYSSWAPGTHRHTHLQVNIHTPKIKINLKRIA